MVTKE